MELGELLQMAARQRASDIFLKEGVPPSLRLHGRIAPTQLPPLDGEEVRQLAYSIMTPQQIARFEQRHELDLAFTREGLARFRANVYQQRGHVGMVLRLIPLELPSLDDLAMPPVLKELPKQRQGLILVTGPTGSGKSTTLAAMINQINETRKANVITVEDPIEFVHPDKLGIVSQREVGIDTESFTTALKYVVRQSPDVILIGEMRDVETMNVALQASETGHLVFSTVHTPSASETMDRIVNMFPPHDKPQICMRLATALRGVVSQKLVPRADSSARVAVVEVMIATPTVSKLVEEGRFSQLYTAISEGGYWGMQTMNQCLLRYFKAGLITEDDALGYAGNITELRQMIRRPYMVHIDELLRMLVQKEASDLHIRAGEPPIMRIHGELTRTEFPPLTGEDTQNLLFAILTEERKQRFLEFKELDLSYAIPGLARFRVNMFRQRGQVGAVLRLIPIRIKTIDELFLPPVTKELCLRPRGLLLVTGPTGSGKSTTLAGMINHINLLRSLHIITIEDPIEFLHNDIESAVNQRELGMDTHSFAAALKHVMRQNPDVILVGEMRDLETISLAITAAETGHLVFATLHTTDAPQTIDRVIDVFPPEQQQQIRMQLSVTLLAVISQTLLPRVDIGGRIAAFEVMVATPAIRALIREGKTHQLYTDIQTGGQHGMQSLDQHLLALLSERKISFEDALTKSSNPRDFEQRAGRFRSTPTPASVGRPR